MKSKIVEKLAGREFSLRERLFRLIILVGFGLSFLGLIECAFVMSANMMVIPFVSLFVGMTIGVILTFKYRKLDLAAIIVGIDIIVIVFPVEFIVCGGINGGASVWFALALFYLFMMFEGKRLIFFLVLTVITDMITYMFAYNYPQYVVPMDTREAVFLDSLFAVLAVGLAGGLIIKFQMYLFEEERAIVLKQKEELLNASESRNAFFARISHEIRTPINTIVGLNEMILRENSSGTTYEYAQNVKSASKMLQTLVNDILDLSRIEGQRMEIYPAPYQTKDIFRELVDMIRVTMQEKKLELFVEIDENIPSVLLGDAGRIKQVLLNILANAVKYTREGSVTLSAMAEESAPGKIRLKVMIADTGIGIRKEDLPGLYEAFRRVDEKNNLHTEGTGLGLSIVKHLLDLMNGEITVDSIYTKGTTFTVELEQEIVDATPVGNVPYLNAAASSSGEVYRQLFEAPEARILLVEDNEMNAFVVTKLLEKTKAVIEIAKDGAECLQKTKQKAYHVIIMDYMMPGMNGGEAIHKLRTQENGLCRESAVILMSANILEQTKSLMKGIRFDSYLEKPIDSTKLEEEVLRFLPDEIVEYRRDKEIYTANEGVVNNIARKKRKRIYITTDCSCDLPEVILKQYDIKTMYLYIKTEQGRFADTREIDSDNLLQYLSEGGSRVTADSVSVEEFETFFADALTEADQVIYISLAKNSGRTYRVATEAAESFDHVQVLDAGHISGGQGMVVIYAARLAEAGLSVTEICEKVEKMKGHVVSKFILPSADIFCEKGHAGNLLAKFCGFFNLHPVVASIKSKMIVVGLLGGSLESSWKFFLHFHMHRKKQIHPGLVIVTHVSCSVKEQEFILNEIKKFMAFEEVILQKASFTNACNAGVRTIGISYYVK